MVTVAAATALMFAPTSNKFFRSEGLPTGE
jgi:hypothetical protein